MKLVRSAAVIGSGVMGAAIAAHLANAGIRCLLLDIVPTDLTPEEEAKGLTNQHPRVRNRLAESAVTKLIKTNPAPLYSDAFIDRITPGNIEDHLPLLSDVDWIIEVVVEKLDVKKNLFRRIEAVWKPGIIVSSNTSGISIREMVSECSPEFKHHFLGTHFFNPPRYMKLLEIIPGENTDPEIVRFMAGFCEKTLGKSVVITKDTPNFIANRIGTYSLLVTLHEMLEKGYTVEEVDAITGPAIGRPNSATLRTLDLVGLDTMVHVARNVYDNVTDEGEKAVFAVPTVVLELVERGWIGEKKGQGFYKRVKGTAGSEIQALNLQTLEYAASSKVDAASLEAAKKARGAEEKLKALLGTPDRCSEFAWNVLKRVLIYSAEKLGEIAESILDIDQAMKWGFNWELGPFETWDAIGLRESVEKMESEGLNVPDWVRQWIASGNESFYQRRAGELFYYRQNTYKALEARPELISLRTLKEQNKVIISNNDASLIDLGDGVACLEFHSRNNAIGPDILQMISQSVDEVRQNYRGLVFANEGRNFCVGANIMQLLTDAQDGKWDEIDGYIRLFQDTIMKVKYLEKPVVTAPHRMALGGATELSMAVDQILFSAETYYGLVETGVGLIPGGGGCKEFMLRASQQFPDPEMDMQPAINKIFDTIGMAKVSTSGHDTKRLGYMSPNDSVVINQDFRIYEAKQALLRLDQAGYQPKTSEKIRVVGEPGKAVLQFTAYSLRQGGYISEHDQLIANKLAHVLAGGNVPAGSLVTEQYLLDLEREAFLSLSGEVKTQQRIKHTLTTGKPLRN